VVGYVIGVLFFVALYLAPTIVAVVYKSKHLLAVVLVDILLAWTLIGWVVAWVLVFTGRREDAQPQQAWPTAYPGDPGAQNLSPDRMFWWDGIAWRDTRVVAPPWAARSADGSWWWDGHQWRQVPTPPPQQHQLPPPSQTQPQPPA
jgi:hypothetical protein